MCRLFGLHAGARRVEAAFWLLDAPDSLEEQSHRNPDGCGVAGFDPSGQVELHKAPVAAWDDPTFDRATRRLRSSTFVAHVRHASTGARSYDNTHPFVEGDVIFAHNGALAGLDQVEAQLGEYRRVVHGDTDSERMFALILKQTAAHHDCPLVGRARPGFVAQPDRGYPKRPVGAALPRHRRPLPPRPSRRRHSRRPPAARRRPTRRRPSPLHRPHRATLNSCR
jgi:hypothetical protein